MKRLIAILLALALIFSLAACGGEQTPTGDGSVTSGTDDGQTNTDTNTNTETGYAETVFAADRVFSTSSGVTTLNDLSNTYYKLTQEKKLTVAYLGGSVTDGTGGTNGYCWAKGVTDWLKASFPSAEITESNNGWGNKSSLWGYFRADGDTDWGRSSLGKSLIEAKPDLVFLEFAINDWLVRMPEMRTVHYMEGIINKIRDALPETDIVIVFITEESYVGKDLPTAPAQQKLADFYGIPTIDVGAALSDYIAKTGTPFGDLFTDNVHPNNAGYKVYADCIAEYLKEKLITKHPNPTGVKNCEMPSEWYLSNGTKKSVIVTAEQIAESTDVTGWTLMKSPSNQVGYFGKSLYGRDGQKITYEFEGTGFCMMVDAKVGSAVKYVVDGKEKGAVSVANSIHTELMVVENLAPGKHKIELTVASGERFIIGAFMIEQ